MAGFMSGLRFPIWAEDKTTRAFQSVKSNVDGLKTKFSGLTRSLGGFGAALATAFSINALKGVAEYADQLQKTSIRLGITTEALSEYAFISDLAGVSQETLFKGIQKLGKSVSDASRGLKVQNDALGDLGLRWQDLIGLGLDEQFEIVGNALLGVGNQADKVRIANDLLGRSGVELLTVFDGGAESMTELRERAQELNVTLSEDTANAIADMNDAWTEVGAATKGVGLILLDWLAPALEAVGHALATLIGWIGKFLNALGKIDEVVAYTSIKLQEMVGLIDSDVAFEAQKELYQRWNDISDSTEDAAKKTAKYNLELDETGRNMRGVAKAAKEVKLPWLEDDQKQREEAEREAERSMDRIKDTFKDGITDVIRDFDSLGDVVKNTMAKIGDYLLQSQLDQIFKGINFGGGGGIFGGLGNVLNDVLGGSGGGSGGGLFSGIGDFFGGFFASGGNFSAGRPIVVGERGPEIIMPRQSGTVIPNHALGASPVMVNMNVNTPDVRSFRASQAQIATEMATAINIANKRNM